ncbi:hypothetical protein FACS189434_06720 [Bacteroidia bacterium]|nr:hypothetical protein FACS189434_06720 [Bacteroidia bacterium]
MTNLFKIKEIARVKKISLKTLAKYADITEQGLQKLIRENSTKVETLEKIAATLGVSVGIFFDEPNSDASTNKNNSGVIGDGVKSSNNNKNSGVIGDGNHVNPNYDELLDIIKEKDIYIKKIIHEAYSRDKENDVQMSKLTDELIESQKQVRRLTDIIIERK